MFNSITGRNEIGGSLPVSIPGTDLTIGFGQKKKLNKLFIQDAAADSNYNFAAVDSVVNKAIHDSVFPGAVVLVGHRKRVVYNKPFGRFTYDGASTEMSTESIFDLASVTKVAATTSAVMLLYDKGMFRLDQKVSSILSKFRGHDKEAITIEQLLVHNSGLPAFKRYYKQFNTREEIVNDIMNTELIFKPGTDYTYSDLGMITMQLIIEKLTGQPIDQFLKSNVFDVLGMTNTMYNPPPEKWYYCVPTEVDDYWRYTTCKGKVHDENAFLMGGVAGHAGLFSTTTDLAKLMFLYINDGYYNGKTIFKPETINLFTSLRSRYGDRGLGWGIKSVDGYSSAGSKFSNTSFGHTGFTGTSIWVDKEKGVFVILLTNRVYPTRQNTKISSFRPKLHDAVIDAVSYR
jgi:CubicO group peptidase (beta-lactamase class C family)